LIRRRAGGRAAADALPPYHPDLARARWIPPVAAGPRTVRLFRASPRPLAATADVRIDSVELGGRLCRVFRPLRPAAAPNPVVFWIHGGGLVLGTPQQDDTGNLELARVLGVTVVAPSYRLAPEHPGPAALDDVAAALGDLHRRADEFGVDPTRVVIGGASAGAGLAAALVHRLHDEGAPEPVLQLLLYPMLDDRTVLRTDIDTRRLRGWTPRANRFGWQSYLGAEPGSADIPAELAPARRLDLSGLPPAWIAVGTLDLFHDEDADYARRLREAGVPCEFVEIPGAFHGFDMFFPRAGVTRDLRAQQADAVGRALGIR
jgi:acetyl esterase/lipase